MIPNQNLDISSTLAVFLVASSAAQHQIEYHVRQPAELIQLLRLT